MSGIIGQGNIIKEGLIFWLDSANPKSFTPPYTTTTWRSLDSNSNSVTLTNGPTFSTDFGGIITFDGTDDGLGQSQLNTNLYNLNQWYHIIMSMRKTSSTTGEWFVMRNGIMLTQQTLTDISWWQNYSSAITNDGNRIQTMTGVSNHDRSIMRLYRKGLTQQEALRNYNATRGRFGL